MPEAWERPLFLFPRKEEPQLKVTAPTWASSSGLSIKLTVLRRMADAEEIFVELPPETTSLVLTLSGAPPLSGGWDLLPLVRYSSLPDR